MNKNKKSQKRNQERRHSNIVVHAIENAIIEKMMAKWVQEKEKEFFDRCNRDAAVKELTDVAEGWKSATEADEITAKIDGNFVETSARFSYVDPAGNRWSVTKYYNVKAFDVVDSGPYLPWDYLWDRGYVVGFGQ